MSDPKGRYRVRVMCFSAPILHIASGDGVLCGAEAYGWPWGDGPGDVCIVCLGIELVS